MELEIQIWESSAENSRNQGVETKRIGGLHGSILLTGHKLTTLVPSAGKICLMLQPLASANNIIIPPYVQQELLKLPTT